MDEMYSYFQGEGCNFYFEEYQVFVRVATCILKRL